MFNKKPSHEEQLLAKVLDGLYDEMSSVDANTDKFAAMTDQFVKLYPLTDHNSDKRIKPDTLALIGANLLGIAMIVGHERANVVTSKALSFITKLR